MNKKTEETVMRDNASVQAPVASEERAAAVTPATAVAAAIKAAPDAK